jgi:hypothetical protein
MGIVITFPYSPWMIERRVHAIIRPVVLSHLSTAARFRSRTQAGDGELTHTALGLRARTPQFRIRKLKILWERTLALPSNLLT